MSSRFPIKTLHHLKPGYRISEGSGGGYTGITMFGRNPSVDIASGEEDIWYNTTDWVAPTAARVHNIVSSSIFDDSGSTGALTVRVYGIDDSGNMVTEDVTMDGASNVATANSYLHIYKMEVTETQSTSWAPGGNAGQITATAQTDSTVTCAITPNAGTSHQTPFLIPYGMDGYLTRVSATMTRGAAAGNIEIRLFSKPAIDSDLWKVCYQFGFLHGAVYNRDFSFPIKFGPGEYIKFTATASGDGSDVNLDYDLLLVGSDV